MRLFIFISIALVTFSCNNNPATEKETPISLTDSLLSDVLAGHDVAMPKMMKLNRLKKEAQAELDSLKKKSTNKNAARITILDSTLKNLNYADVAMNEWMEGFKYDSLKSDETARQAYLKQQLTSVNEMKDIVLSSIEKADSVLAK